MLGALVLCIQSTFYTGPAQPPPTVCHIYRPSVSLQSTNGHFQSTAPSYGTSFHPTSPLHRHCRSLSMQRLKTYLFRRSYQDLLTLLHDELHWLDVPERVTFKLGLMTYRCLHGQAPRYLADHVTPAIEVCMSTSATFRQPTPTHCASLSTQHIRSSGFSDCWSDGLEVTAR